MKVFVASCLFLALACASSGYEVKSREHLLQYRSECVAELNIPDAHVAEYKEFKYPNDAITHCYLKCIFNKFGLFDESGFIIDNIYQQLVGSYQGEDLRAQIESCVDANEQGSGVCEWVYRGATCFFKHNLELVQKSVA